MNPYHCLLLVLITFGCQAETFANSPAPDNSDADILSTSRFGLHSSTSDTYAEPLGYQFAPDMLLLPEVLQELELSSAIDRLEYQLMAQREQFQESEYAERIRQKQLRQLIESQRVDTGMSPAQVLESWGQPSGINRLKDGMEQWLYQRTDGRYQTLYFNNGSVIGLE